MADNFFAHLSVSKTTKPKEFIMKANRRTNKTNLSKQTQKTTISQVSDLPPGVTSVIPGGCFPMSLYGGLAKTACQLLREGKSASEAKAILDAQVMERATTLS